MDAATFNGRSVHAVQIGLGTFGTFVQNLTGEKREWNHVIGWLLESTSEWRSMDFRGVAVEPVSEHVERLRPLIAELPHVELVQAAIGEEEETSVEIHVLTQSAHDNLLSLVASEHRNGLEDYLVYLRNMSCVGSPHPELEYRRCEALRKFGVDINVFERQFTQIWSYGRLATQFNFCGCELLIIDAEGHDAKILRSMISHCLKEDITNVMVWPDVIAFETLGHCDCKEGPNTEALIVRDLEIHGYILFWNDYANKYMVKCKALEMRPSLQEWLGTMVCTSCKGSGNWPFNWKMECSCCDKEQNLD